MLGWVSLAIGVAGFGVGGYLDLKTTEFPDWLPYSMIIAALLVRGVFSFLLNDWSLLVNSLIIGCIYLGIGLLLYFTKQWGDGDAWLLGAMGFLFPDSMSFSPPTMFPFPVAMFFNFLFIALFYLIIYSVFLGMKDKGIREAFRKELKGDRRSILLFTLLFFLMSWGSAANFLFNMSAPLESLYTIIYLPFLLFLILVFIRYARVIEKHSFKKKIPSGKLKEGDVLLSEKWKGITAEEVEVLKKSKKFVWIKEGVRFAPVFIITMMVTLFFGDLMLILI